MAHDGKSVEDWGRNLNLNQGDSPGGMNEVNLDDNNGDWNLVVNKQKQSRNNKGKNIVDSKQGLCPVHESSRAMQSSTLVCKNSKSVVFKLNGASIAGGPEDKSTSPRPNFVFDEDKFHGVIKGRCIMGIGKYQEGSKKSIKVLGSVASSLIPKPRMKSV